MKFIEANSTGFTSGAQVGAFKGAVKDLSNNKYHSLKKYFSSSELKNLYATSPAHFKYDRDEQLKSGEGKKQTYDMILGSLVHCLILTPDRYEKEFFVMPDLNFRTNEGKAAREEILAANIGKTPINDEMLIQANEMRSSALSNSKVNELLAPGIKEASYFWSCPFSNLNFKAQLDHSSSQHFCELKTTGKCGAKESAWSAHMFNMNYDLSLFHYREGLKHTMLVEPPAYFIVIERDAPYVTQIYKVSEATWETGREKWLSAVSKLERGFKENIWPGYFPTNEIPEISPPAWGIKQVMPVGDFGGI